MEIGEFDRHGLFCFFLFASCSSGLGFGVHGFGLAQQDAAEAGAFFFSLFFWVGGLLDRADEGAVFVLVGFADCLRGDVFFGGHGGAVAAVLRCDLKAVDEDAGAARVDAVRGQGEDYVGQGELDGVGVFERGEGEGCLFWARCRGRRAGFLAWGGGCWSGSSRSSGRGARVIGICVRW